MLEKNAALTHQSIESTLRSTVLPVASNDSRAGVLDPFLIGAVYAPAWDTDCGGQACDPVGAGALEEAGEIEECPLGALAAVQQVPLGGLVEGNAME